MAKKTQISNLAYVDKRAQIGKNVKIDPFATIHGDVSIGDGCWIASNVVIHDGARIGSNCSIFPGAVISTIPMDMKYAGEMTTVEIGNNTTIREFATIKKGTNYAGKTVIGSNVLLMAYAHVAHDCIIKDHAILANAVNLAGHVTVEEWAILGGMSAAHQFCRIGKHVILAGGSLVGKDVPPYTKAAHFPLKYAGVNSIGLKRRGFEQETIHEIQDIYRILYNSGLNVSQAVERIEEEIAPSDEKEEILKFIRSSERGLMKGVA